MQWLWPMPQWQTSMPEAEGTDSAALAKLVAYGQFLQLRQSADRPPLPHRARCDYVTKAVAGTLIAIALLRTAKSPTRSSPLLPLSGRSESLRRARAQLCADSRRSSSIAGTSSTAARHDTILHDSTFCRSQSPHQAPRAI
jgi:hypothetical protein